MGEVEGRGGAHCLVVFSGSPGLCVVVKLYPGLFQAWTCARDSNCCHLSANAKMICESLQHVWKLRMEYQVSVLNCLLKPCWNNRLLQVKQLSLQAACARFCALKIPKVSVLQDQLRFRSSSLWQGTGLPARQLHHQRSLCRSSGPPYWGLDEGVWVWKLGQRWAL